MIDIKNVTFRYKGAKESTLDNVSLQIARGEVVLLCGASGSGKTSLIRLMNGLIPHYYKGELSGTTLVEGQDVAHIPLYDLAGVVGTVFQNPRSQFFSVDTDGEIVFGPENIGLDPAEIKNRKATIVQQMHLKKLLGRSLFELSGGEKQRIACASVAALLPDIILLDEPTSNLDYNAIGKLHDIIVQWKNQGKTIVISEHRLWYLTDVVDRVIYMNHGRIINEWSGSAFQKLSQSEIRGMKLRPTKLADCFGAVFRGEYAVDYQVEDNANGITLRDYYFSYLRKPYLFWKKAFCYQDDRNLQLNVPKLVLPKGKVIGVIGRNGTGKSTFLRCICGLERDCTGVIIADGKTYKGKDRIGKAYMVMQDVNHQLFTDSVAAEVLLSMEERDEVQAHKILEELDLLEYKDSHPMALSGGQKQRVAIASAIASGAEMLLFDEPTSGLDYAHMEIVGNRLHQLAEAGKTVLVSTHDPELLEMCCDYKLYVKKGRVGFVEPEHSTRCNVKSVG